MSALRCLRSAYIARVMTTYAKKNLENGDFMLSHILSGVRTVTTTLYGNNYLTRL